LLFKRLKQDFRKLSSFPRKALNYVQSEVGLARVGSVLEWNRA